jgi:hypothetical protein
VVGVESFVEGGVAASSPPASAEGSPAGAAECGSSPVDGVGRAEPAVATRPAGGVLPTCDQSRSICVSGLVSAGALASSVAGASAGGALLVLASAGGWIVLASGRAPSLSSSS